MAIHTFGLSVADPGWGGGGGGGSGCLDTPPSNLNMNIISNDVSHVRYTFLRSALREVAK